MAKAVLRREAVLRLQTRDPQASAGWTTLTALSTLAVLAVLVLATGGPAQPESKTTAQAAECVPDGGTSPSPTGSPTSSPTGSPGLPLPTLPTGGGSPTSTQSPTQTASPTEGPETQRCDSTITIGYKSRVDAFKGTVRSERSDCEAGRKVVLTRDRARPQRDLKVGATVTNQRGKWTVRGLEDPPGKYYATVKKETDSSGEGKLVCGADRSRTINP
jgi:hypothetical protein